MPTPHTTDTDGLAALVAIVRAAHLTGDTTLERAARRKLQREYGVDIAIRRESATQQEAIHR